MTRNEFDCLWDAATGILRRAVEEGHIITVEYAGHEPVPQAEGRYVYKQAACRRCRTPSHADTLSGRTAYHCPHCQPR